MSSFDPIELTKALVSCPSITPHEGGALDYLGEKLQSIGFECHRLPFSEDGHEDVDNLFAIFNPKGTGKHFAFAGHTDVVPPGATDQWKMDPFSPLIEEDKIYGRGVADMKGAIASFISATQFFLEKNSEFDGTISLIITGDEEGIAINGTKKMLHWIQENNVIPDVCVVGEPSNPKKMGEMIKNGRRGSVSMELKVFGEQGHVAYPHLAQNPCHAIIDFLKALVEQPLDEGNASFQPSSLQITTIDVGNETSNVIPETARAKFNIRFNNIHTGESLIKKIQTIFDEVSKKTGFSYSITPRISGEAFLNRDKNLEDLLQNVIKEKTGINVELSTSGGTSDARFIQAICPVVEFGLVGQTMHKVNENVNIHDIYLLKDIYLDVMEKYFYE